MPLELQTLLHGVGEENLQFTVGLTVGGASLTLKKCNNNTIPQVKSFLNSNFFYTEWKSVWNSNNNYCVTTKSKKLVLKTLHLIYPTIQVITRFRVVERSVSVSVNCVFCNSYLENVCHLFFKCLYVKIFWLNAEHYFKALTGLTEIKGKRHFYFLQ